MSQQTLPYLLLQKAKVEGKKTAFRQKDLGIWNEWTWSDYYTSVQALAIGLKELYDINKSDVIGIIGDNRPEWLVAQLAIQSIGAIPAGIFQDATPEQLIHYIEASKSKLLIVEDQEQVDKVLEIIDTLPQIEAIIYYDDKGLRKYNHKKLSYFKKIQEKGISYLSTQPMILEETIQQIQPTDIALIAFTSGATQRSKAAKITHQNIIETALAIDHVDSVYESYDYLSFLSLAWVCEQVIAVGLSLTKGMTINFPEEPSTVLNDLREIGPHIIQAPPRFYENTIARFEVRMGDSTRFKKKVFSMFEPLIKEMACTKLSNQSVSKVPKFKYLMGDYLLFSAIRDHLGLSRLKRAYVSGGSISSEVFEFFHGIGVNVKQTYGTVETTGFASIQMDGHVNTEAAGVPLRSTSISLTEDKEVIVQGSGVFDGYVDEVSTSSEFRTGDHGRLDKDELVITDRFDELIITPTGDHVSSTWIESKLRRGAYIQEAVVFGKDRPYITAMLNINMASVGRWAEKNQITYTTYSDLTKTSEVIELIRNEVAEIMKTIPPESTIKRFVILPHELDVSKGEMTPTQKIVREVVALNYKDYLVALYQHESDDDDISQSSKYPVQLDDEKSLVQIISLEMSQGVA
ncbi:AMP-binding protein [Bacillus solimangrovi]|nr:AMP-binding protein [Bacillus solimangrovi]